MVFRADEATQNGYERAENYLLSSLDVHQRKRSKIMLADIIDKCGPVIDSYPSWHPLVSHCDSMNPQMTPNESCGYIGLDHTIFFVNGFITCPYGDGQEVIDSVENLPANSVASFSADKLDGQFYSPNATPILVHCHWDRSLSINGIIPKSLAIPLLLKYEMSGWEDTQRAETWETMRPYLLGSPCGRRSSLFVNQETGQTIKKLWNLLINTGMFGPIKV